MIAGIFFQLLGDLVLYAIGRFAIIVLSLGYVRPRSLKKIWGDRGRQDQCVDFYYEIMLMQFLGAGVIAVAGVIYAFLHR